MSDAAADTELGARLSLKDRAKFHRDATESADDIKRIGDEAKRSGSKAKSASNDYAIFGRGFKFVGGLAVRGAALVAGGAALAGGALIKMGIDATASFEQNTISFNTLLGSAAKGQKFLADLQQFAAATPFELPGLIDASRQLLGVGTAAKDVLPDLTALGDTSGALGLSQDSFNRSILALTQSMGEGKIRAGDMLQITQAGIPVWSLLSKALGKPIGKVRELASQGKLLTQDVLPKLFKQMEKDYGGAMSKQSQTLNGLMSTLKDNVRLTALALLRPFLPSMKSATNLMIGLTGRVRAWSGGLSDTVPLLKTLWATGDMSSFNQVLSGTLTGGQELTPILDKMVAVGEDIGTVYGQSVKPAFDEIAGALGPLGLLVEPFAHIDDELKFMSDHGTLTKNVVLAIVSALLAWKLATIGFIAVDKTRAAIEWLNIARSKEQTSVTIGQRLVTLAITAATKAWAGAQFLINAAMSANPIGLIVVGLALLVTGLILAYKKSETFRHFVQRAFAATAQAGGYLVYALVKGFKMFFDFVMSGVGLLVHSLAAAFGWLPHGLGAHLKAAARSFDDFKSTTDHKMDEIANSALGWGQAVADHFRKGFNDKPLRLYTHSRVVDGVRMVDSMKMLATGGIVTRATPAVIGEAGPEAVIPLESGIGQRIIRGAQQSSATDTRALAPQGARSEPIVIQLVVGRRVLAEAVHEDTRDRAARL